MQTSPLNVALVHCRAMLPQMCPIQIKAFQNTNKCRCGLKTKNGAQSKLTKSKYRKNTIEVKVEVDAEAEVKTEVEVEVEVEADCILLLLNQGDLDELT